MREAIKLIRKGKQTIIIVCCVGVAGPPFLCIAARRIAKGMRLLAVSTIAVFGACSAWTEYLLIVYVFFNLLYDFNLIPTNDANDWTSLRRAAGENRRAGSGVTGG